jgi:CNT family concentrative nucleoside transporter
MQLVAWLVFVICTSVIATGVVVSKTGPALAQDTGVEQTDEPVEDVVEGEPSGVGAGDELRDEEVPLDDAEESDDDQEQPAEGEPAAEETEADGGGGGDSAQEVAFERKVGQGDPSSVLDRSLSFFGIFFFILIAWGMSTNRRRVNWVLVAWGVGLQLLFAIIIFFVPGGEAAFDFATQAVKKLLDFTNEGADFIFSSYVTNEWDPALINFSFAVLPTIIFFSSLMTILYHLGVMQRIVYVFAWIMQRTMHTSGAESLSAAANIFVGQTEAPLVFKPYVDDMTMSELMTVMTGGFATVAGGVLAIYVGMLEPMFPDIAGHLLAASVMSAPAALVIGKIMFPETEVPETSGELEMTTEKEDVNVLDAASRGAAEGLKLALNVAAMLLAFIALIELVNYLISFLFFFMENPLTLQDIFGYLFAPIAWFMGVPWDDCFHIGRLLGVKMIVNELVAYAELQAMLKDSAIHLQDRSVIIATYALCGFANFGSIGIQLGGIGGIAPNRRHDLAKIALRAMIAGTIAAFMTATIAGILV